MKLYLAVASLLLCSMSYFVVKHRVADPGTMIQPIPLCPKPPCRFK